MQHNTSEERCNMARNVKGAGKERQDAVANCLPANDARVHGWIAIIRVVGSRGFQLVTDKSLRTRSSIERLETELHALRSTSGTNSSSQAIAPLPRQNSSRSSSISAAQQIAAPTLERTRRVTELRPPADLVVSLMSLYFRHVHPWFPFLDVQRVFGDLGSKDEPSMLHHALFGVALPYSFDSRLDQISSDSFWKYSKRRIFIDVLEEPSYSSLEVLAVLILDLSSMTHSAQVSGPLAVATRLAVQLRNTDGLVFRTSAEAGTHATLSRREVVSRQRLFWAIYALDSTISITTNCISTLSDIHVQHFLPTRDAVWRDNQPELGESAMTPAFIFSYQLELYDLARTAHRVGMDYADFCNGHDTFPSWQQDFETTSSKLDAWISSVPPQLLWNDQSGAATSVQSAAHPAVLMLHGYFHALMIYLNGYLATPARGIANPETDQESYQRSHERCLCSSRILAEIVTKAGMQIVDKLGWPFAWSVWVAARFLISWRYNSGRDESDISERVSIFCDLLDRMSRYSQISSMYSRLLRQSLSEIETGGIVGQNTVLYLVSDWRVPTSRLEDLARSDPMLHAVTSPSLTDSNPNYADMQQFNPLLPVFSNNEWVDMSNFNEARSE
ncbi:positive regulator of purine utilization [Fusarium sporotrichioides]|uniref:Positive regulator of purine utilization n=1 Tax=Fusarium sporotrichioides TaxID=5514 RepID=A0A395SUW7_FUSSP|nr:positive regulator of purine utilization [Fusarium sporotrichioides]